MENEYYDQFENLLLSGEKENIKLAFMLEESLKIDLTPLLRKMEKALQFSGYWYDGMPLEDIPEQLQFVESLYIDTDKDFSDVLKYLRHIKILHLNDTSNGQFFSFYPSFEHLEELSIDSAFLIELPSWVTQLSSLKRLTLYCKKLCKFPEDFGKLTTLEYISLTCSPVLQIPKSAHTIGTIKDMQLQHSIPLGMSNFAGIERCFFEDIKTIPESMEQVPIDYLYCSGSPGLPQNLKFLGSINNLEVYIPAKRRKAVAPPYHEFKQLHKLILSLGTVDFPDAICSIKGLQYLLIQHARIQQIPPAFALLKDDLKTLEITYSTLNQDCIEDLKKLLPHTQIIEQDNAYDMTWRKYYREKYLPTMTFYKKDRFYYTLFFLFLILLVLLVLGFLVLVVWLLVWLFFGG